MRSCALLLLPSSLLLVACGEDPGARDPTAGTVLPTTVTLGGTDDGDTTEAATMGDATGGGDCTRNDECDPGSICDGGSCVPGCADDQPCADDLSCCGGTCVDTNTDAANCGGCDMPCTPAEHATITCEAAACVPSGCEDGWSDCDGMAADGCETEGECACTPGAVQDCYTGDPLTMGVGPCTTGTQTCNEFGSDWGPCEDEVLPASEICGNAADDDCNGQVDDDPDADGDGWTACGGDCCDTPGRTCSDPELVNPGAFEVPDNDVDDDCDGMQDNPLPPCDAGLASNSADPLQYAQAIDLCQFTDEMPADPGDRIWGVIEGGLVRADGAGVPASQSRSLRDGFGANIDNRFGDRLAVLSTGRAADDFDDVNPGFLPFQLGEDMGTASAFPGDWYAANGNSLPNAPGCVEPIDASAQDPVMLRLRVRVPTNANSFSVDMYFFSAEYPEYVCTAFNDFFVTLVDSTEPTNPADGNIAIYDDGMDTWPVGVNILSAANGLFTSCTDGTISDCGSPTAYNGCTSNVELAGTGFDLDGETFYACDYGGEAGGGTGWLTMSGNVTPGETMEIRFAIWDTSDGLFDSLVLLDNWQWSVQASEPGVEPG